MAHAVVVVVLSVAVAVLLVVAEVVVVVELLPIHPLDHFDIVNRPELDSK